MTRACDSGVECVKFTHSTWNDPSARIFPGATICTGTVSASPASTSFQRRISAVKRVVYTGHFSCGHSLATAPT